MTQFSIQKSWRTVRITKRYGGIDSVTAQRTPAPDVYRRLIVYSPQWLMAVFFARTDLALKSSLRRLDCPEAMGLNWSGAIMMSEDAIAPASVKIRQLNVDDLELFRRIRAEAVQNYRQTFGSPEEGRALRFAADTGLRSDIACGPKGAEKDLAAIRSPPLPTGRPARLAA
jgi:hypothetical protein